MDAYHNVDISSIKNENLRSIGAEYACTEQGRSVVHSFYEKIGLNQILKELGMSLQDRQIAEILVDNRLIAPGSEKHAFGHYSKPDYQPFDKAQGPQKSNIKS